MEPGVSIILPSHNGSDTLPRCLDALAAVDFHGLQAEILLIDNASSDETAAILADHARSLGGRVITEPRRGKSFALNTGIDASSKEFLVFIDDDVLPDRDWLWAFAKAAEETPHAAVFAGQIRPEWTGPVPDWLERMADEGRCCGCTERSRTAGPYPAIHVKGGNVMIRRSALGDLRFDTGAGNFDGSARAVGGEDTGLMDRLAARGHGIVFVPGARVRHILQPEETTVAALFRRQVRIGRASAAHRTFSLRAKLLTVPAIGAYAIAVVALFAMGRRTHAIKQLLKIATRLGRIDRWVFPSS